MFSATFAKNIKAPGRYGDGRGGFGLGLLVRPATRGGLNKSWTPGVFGFGPAAFPCSGSWPEPPAPPGLRSSSRSGAAGLQPGSLASGAPAPATSRRAARRVLARSVVRIVLRRRFRGRARSRQRRVSRDCRPACNPRSGRTRSRWIGGPGAWRACRRRRPASGAGARDYPPRSSSFIKGPACRLRDPDVSTTIPRTGG